MRHLRYLRIVLGHKWYVLVAGLRIGGIPLRRLLAHDASKFSRAEWPYYARRYGTSRGKYIAVDGWAEAWAHHVRRNPHHWDHWVDHGAAPEIPEAYAREMVADWMAAGKAYTGEWDAPAWYDRNRTIVTLHPRTRALVERLLSDIGQERW